MVELSKTPYQLCNWVGHFHPNRVLNYWSLCVQNLAYTKYGGGEELNWNVTWKWDSTLMPCL